MTRVEIIVPSWRPEVPASLLLAFKEVAWFDAGGSNAFAIFGCDLSRRLSDPEIAALDEALLSGEIRDYDTLTR